MTNDLRSVPNFLVQNALISVSYNHTHSNSNMWINFWRWAAKKVI